MARIHSHDPLNKQIVDEAAEWFVEFSTDEPDTRARRAFDNWLRKSPEHVRAYVEMFPIWEDVPLIDRTISAEQLIALSRSADKNVVPLVSRLNDSRDEQRGEVSRRHRNIASGWYSLAAGLLLAVAGAGSWFYLLRGTYTTDIGEQRVITLADGSDVELNARSKIRVDFKDSERRVELLAGQALFRVAKHKNRPFVVESGDTKVRAVGTEFDVYRKRIGTTVTVVEGRVAVHTGRASRRAASTLQQEDLAAPNPETSDVEVRRNGGSFTGEHFDTAKARTGSARSPSNQTDARLHSMDFSSALQATAGEIILAAGEQLTVTPTAIAKPQHADVASATAWRQRRLVFSATPLTEVAEEFNRYNDRQLIILSPTLDTFDVSAVFSATDIPSLLRFLRAQPNIVIDESDSEIRISSSRSR